MQNKGEMQHFEFVLICILDSVFGIVREERDFKYRPKITIHSRNISKVATRNDSEHYKKNN